MHGEHFSVQPADSNITNGIAATIRFRDGSIANYRSAWGPGVQFDEHKVQVEGRRPPENE